MLTRRRALGVAAGLVALAVSPAWAGKPGVGTGSLAFKAGVLLRTPPNSIYGITQAEPSLQVDSEGRIYVAAPAANVIGCEFWTLPSDLSSQRFTVPPDNGIGGGDCDLAVSRTTPAGQAYPTVSYSSLYLANLVVAKSTDGGATFTSPPNPVGSQISGADREWMAAAEGSTVYMSYHIVVTNNIQVERSTDGGATFALANPVPAPGSGQAIDQGHIAQALYNNELGPIVVDFSSSAAVKPVYTIFTAPHSAAENTGSGDGSTHTFNRDVFLAASYDSGATWTDNTIFEGPIERTYDHIFPALAIDAGGGFWAAWASDEQHVYVTHAPPGSKGATSRWTAPKRVDVGTSVANVYPWLVGGGAGRADLVWYSGTSTDPALTNLDPTNAWKVKLAQLAWSSKAGLTVPAVADASDHVIHNGKICTTGVTCSPLETGRNLLDFFQVALPPDGRAAIAWADDHATPGAQIYVTVQCSGLSATTGKALPSTC